MSFDSAEETLTLTMGELQIQLPRTGIQPALSPPPQQPLYSLKYSSTSSEQVDFSDAGYSFYSSPFDNSFPNRGNLSNERRFSCSSPTSNTSFLSSETSFSTQSLLRNSNDSGIACDSFGLLTTTSTPYRGNDANNLSSDFQRLRNRGGGAAFNNNGGELPGGNFLASSSQVDHFNNDCGLLNTSLGSISSGIGSGLGRWESPSKPTTSTPTHSQFDFSFPASESSVNGGILSSNSSACSSNGSSNASADSPTRLIAAATAAGTLPSSYTNQWNSSDVSSLLDDQSPIESSSSYSVIPTSALGTSIWSPSSQVSAAQTNNATNGNGYINNGPSKNSGNSLNWDESLARCTKHQLLQFIEVLKKERENSLRNGDEGRANQIQGILVQVQNYIINTFVSESSESVSGSVSTPTTITSPISPTDDRSPNFHRETKDANYTWSGQLPPRNHRNPTYSCKVFLGGLPWDITESTLMQTFKTFGIIKIEWPGKEGVSTKPKGYAYAVFESEKQVKLLLQNCTHDYNHNRAGNYYYKVSSKKFRGKDVQIIPWALCDSNHNRCQASKIDPLKTIFVGALHGMVNAEGLAKIMNDLFGGVVYAGIDTDSMRYPIGSARVTFSNTHSYMKAVNAKFVFIKTSRFEKKLQVDPYLEDATCSVCNLQQGPYFCRERVCFGYFCRTCFHHKHADPALSSHEPMMRTTHNKNQQRPQQSGPIKNFNGNNNNNGGGYNGFNGFNNGHHQSSYSYGVGGGNNHQHHQPSYAYGGGSANNQHHNGNNSNNHNGSPHHGFNNGGGNNNRHWTNVNNGRNSPQVSYPGGGGPGFLKRPNTNNRFF